MDVVIKKGKSCILCKLDLEKAYDRVIWDFLDYMLRRLGFGIRWRQCMQICYGTASFSILLNGVLVECFHGS